MGAAVSVPTHPGLAATGPVGPAGSAHAAAVLKSYTAEDHRRRLQSIGVCQTAIRACLRKHLVTNYLPAQCVYNLGEYPCRKPYDPDEYDERELDRLKDQGIQLIQVMDDWNDQLRLCGGHKLTALNPDGFRRFVAMVHQRGMKILAYASSGYFIRTDPDYREEWSRPGDGFFGGYWNLMRCSPASPGWRAYLLPRMVRILDDFDVDGLYNDWGYVPNAMKGPQERAKDEVAAFEETPQYDGAVADLLQLIPSVRPGRSLETALPGGVGISSSPSERPARLWRLGCRSPARRDPGDARPLAETVPAAGRGGDLGVAGDRRLQSLCQSSSARRRGFGLCQSRDVLGAGQLRHGGRGDHHIRPVRPGWRTKRNSGENMESQPQIVTNPSPRRVSGKPWAFAGVSSLGEIDFPLRRARNQMSC